MKVGPHLQAKAVGRRPAAFLVMVTLCAASLGHAAAQVPENSIGIRLVDAPVERADDPRAQANIVDHLAPGATVERRVEITNFTPEVVVLPLYVGGAELVEGGFRPYEDGATGDLASWGSVEPSEVELAPGASAQPLVRISIPGNASEGERYGVVWVETPKATGAGIEAVNRVGIRIYLSVGPGGEPATDFEIEEVIPSRDPEGRPTIQTALRNTGGRALDITGEVELRDGPAGLSAGPISVPRSTIAIGESGLAIAVLDPALPEGPWTVHMRLRSGSVEREAEAVISFPAQAASVSAPVRVEQPDIVPDIPWPLLIIATGLLVLVLLLLLLLLRRRREEEDAQPAPVSG